MPSHASLFYRPRRNSPLIVDSSMDVFKIPGLDRFYSEKSKLINKICQSIKQLNKCGLTTAAKQLKKIHASFSSLEYGHRYNNPLHEYPYSLNPTVFRHLIATLSMSQQHLTYIVQKDTYAAEIIQNRP